mmetsp:Transcript_18621/g.59289  ORF Transcript_18621/g.59289 Transcript_18621/m.59289 type:complete len:340 (+) Transcript_18621:260-1279(+)
MCLPPCASESPHHHRRPHSQCRLATTVLPLLLLLVLLRLLLHQLGLRLRSAGEEDEHGRHVVARAAREALVQQRLANLLHLVVATKLIADKVHALLVGEHVPDAIACQDQKLIILLALHDLDLGLGRHHLLLRRLRRRDLVAEVTQRPGHSQIAVHTAHGHGAARVHDAIALRRQVRLVVSGHGDGLATTAEHGAGVAAVADQQVVWGDEAHDGSGATVVLARANALRGADGFVERQEALHHGRGHIVGTRAGKLWRRPDLAEKVQSGHIGRHLPAVSVEHAKEGVPWLVGDVGDARVRVLHVNAPTLHGRKSVLESVPFTGVGLLVLDRLVQERAHES